MLVCINTYLYQVQADLKVFFSMSDDLAVSFCCINHGCWNIIIHKSPGTVYTNSSRR